MKTVLRNFGNSVGQVIPKLVREALHMQAGQTVLLEISGQCLLVRPAHQYTLDELLAQCDPTASSFDNQLAAWSDAPPVGREAW